MEETDDFALSSLLCNETESSLNESEEVVGREIVEVRSDFDQCFAFSEEEDEVYLRELVQRERSYVGSGSETPSHCADCTAESGGWIRSARLDAVRWIINTRAVFGFQHHTAYLSIALFDRFLSRRSLDEGKSWAIRLLSVACLSIAAKMEELKVPPLSEFPLEECVFESDVIQKMELLVLSTLGWKMDLISPFAYLRYFVSKFFNDVQSIPNGLISRAVELLLDISKEICLMDHRPSAIAAAAVLAASDSKLTRNDLELKLEQISLWVSQEYECVITCYNLIQKIKTGKQRTPETVIPRGLSNSRDAAFGNSSRASRNDTRRRLTFEDSDLHFPVKKTRRS